LPRRTRMVISVRKGGGEKLRGNPLELHRGKGGQGPLRKGGRGGGA